MVISARHEVLEAFRRLERRSGQRVFRLRDMVVEVLASTNAYSEKTIRTYVTSVMCADAPVHHANHTDDLRRVGHGLYTLNEPSSTPVEPHRNPATAVAASSPPTTESRRPWHWEGNVQAAIVSGLSESGWRIQAVADTASRAAGTDIIANREGTRIHVEVKGYPTSTYARGEKAGQPKPTHPATQARTWFSGAFMKAAMLRNDHPGDAVAMGLPMFETYRSLADRVSATLETSDIRLIWVHETGQIEFSPGFK